MPPPLTLIYDTLEAASQAGSALVGAGFASERIVIDVHEDEAGPAEGNFILGNGRDTTRGIGDPAAWQPYASNFRSSRGQRTTMLTVEAADDALRDEAAAIAARFGGRTPA